MASPQYCTDNFKMMKANYMQTRLLCAHRMTTYVRKSLLLNSKQLLRKLQKILGGYFFAAPCIVILAYSKTFVQKLIPENLIQNWLWYSCLDFITKEMWPWNSPELNSLDYYIWGLSQAPSKMNVSPNSRKCCKWQSNSGFDRQSYKRVLITTESLCCR